MKHDPSISIGEYEQLERRIAELEKELEMRNQYLMHLEGLINEITPLRRHLRRQVKHRLRSTDQKILNKLGSRGRYEPQSPTDSTDLLAAAQLVDRANMRQYNMANRKSALQSVYLMTRRAGIETASRLLRMRKV